MTLPTHRLPPSIFAALAGGGGGADAIGRLRSAQRSKNLMLIRSLVELTEAIGHPDRAAVRAAYRALRPLQRYAPDALLATLCYPPVSAWANETERSLRHGRLPAARPGQLAAVAAVAAIRGGVELDVEIPLAGGTGMLLLPSLGVLALPSPLRTVELHSTARGAEVRGDGVRLPVPRGHDSGAAGWRSVPAVTVERQGLRLTLALDTLSWRDAPETIAAGTHPIERGEVDAGRWRRPVADAWDLLVRHHRPVAEEVAAAITVLVPVRAPAAGLHSGTFHDAFGSIAMSLPPDARLAAVAFAHEIQHAKLAALMDLFPFTEPGPDERFYAPWRSDPRPLVGLLHGAYAHLGVAGFWRRQRLVEHSGEDAMRAEVEFARWVVAAHDVTRRLVEHPRLTPIGRHLVATMCDVLERWRAEPVSVDAAMMADRLTEEHRKGWIRAHGDPATGPCGGRTA